MATCELHVVTLMIVLLCGNVILLTMAMQQQTTKPSSTTPVNVSVCNNNNNNHTSNSNKNENAINAAINENHFAQLEAHNSNCNNSISSISEMHTKIRTTTTTALRPTQINDKRVQVETEMNASNALDYGLNMTALAMPSNQATTAKRAATTTTVVETAEMAAPMKLLSRKRRYLIFPDGSSFQVVYDAIYGVVDYTNYLILGITVALAWELPTEMPSELLETVQGQLANGTLGLSRRKDDNAAKIKYTDIQQPQQQQQQQQPKRQYINAQTYTVLPTNTHYYTSKNNNNNYNNYNKRPTYFQVPMHKQYDFYYRGNVNNNNNNKHSYYYNTNNNNDNSRIRTEQQQNQRNPFKHWQHQALTPHNGIKFPWWRLMKGLSPTFGKWQANKAHATADQRRLDYFANQQQQQPQPKSGYYQTNSKNSNNNNSNMSATLNATSKPKTTKIRKKVQKSSKARKHRIYPIFGKRRRRRDTTGQQQQQQQHYHRHGIREARNDDELDKLDRLHIRHHRWTRHTLYGKIEKYLDRRGTHGQHCVLRALCETAQKSARDREPGTFVGEIMRALFTLPEMLTVLDATDATVREDKLLQHYDEAHAFVGDCAQRYKYCLDSLWTSQFIQ